MATGSRGVGGFGVGCGGESFLDLAVVPPMLLARQRTPNIKVS